jgi:branched-chain amino acid transport system substrate-binding protein
MSVFKRLFIMVALAGCSRTPSGTVWFGAAGPAHDANGAANQRGAELALDEINAGARQGRRFDIKFMDDSANGVRAAGVAQEFVKDPKIVAVIGHVNSGAMMAATRVYDGNLPAIATSATSPALSGMSRWTFRVISSDSLNGIRIATHMGRLGRKRAAVLYENNAYGRGLADAFRRGFTGEIIGMDPVSDRPGEDLEPFVTWFKQQHADLVFVAGTGASGLAFIKEARRQQITADLVGGRSAPRSPGFRGRVSKKVQRDTDGLRCSRLRRHEAARAGRGQSRARPRQDSRLPRESPRGLPRRDGRDQLRREWRSEG